MILATLDNVTLHQQLQQDLQPFLSPSLRLQVIPTIAATWKVLAQNSEVAIAIFDDSLVKSQNYQILKDLHQQWPQTRLILLGIPPDDDLLLLDSIYRYLVKPWQTSDFRITVREALHSYKAAKDQIKVRDRTHDPEASKKRDSDTSSVWDGSLTTITERLTLKFALEARKRCAANLAEFGTDALKTVESQTLMQQAIVLITQTLEVDYGVILEWFPQEQEFSLRARWGWPELHQTPLPLEQNSQISYTLGCDRPVIVSNFATETRFQGLGFVEDSSAVSSVSLLIPGQIQPLGVLAIHSRTPRKFAEDEIAFLQAISLILATSIERQQVQQRLDESQLFLEQVASTSPHLIYVYDLLEQRNIYMNCEVASVLGYSQEQIQAMGKQILPHLVHPDDLKTIVQPHFQRLETIADDEVVEIEYRMRSAKNEWLTLLSREKVFRRTAQGKVQQLIGTAVDISERKQAEVILAQAKEAAEAANRAKSSFIANMSHELRSPLNAILGFTQLLARDRDLSLQNREYLNIIHRNGEQLLHLLNEILEVSKIEAGCMTLNLSCCNVRSLLREIEGIFRLKAAEKGLIFKIAIAPHVPDYIESDLAKLRQILVNLLSNAVKFTVKGGITLNVTYEVALQPCLYLEVQDTGLGIDPDESHFLFQPFVQTRTGRAAQQGKGLGLALCYQYVQFLGGEFDVTSVPNQGSTFRVKIPTAIAPNTAIAPHRKTLQQIIGLAPNQPHYRLLIVDDNPAERSFLINLLTTVGFDVAQADNGKDAVASWQTFQPHLIYVNLNMVEMEGYQATHCIRQLEQTFRKSAIANASSLKPTKIIALTLDSSEQQQHRIFTAGCDDFIIQPIAETLLFDQLSQHLGVSYLYEMPYTEANFPENDTHFDPAPMRSTLAQLPASLRYDLQQAVSALDLNKTKALIDRISQTEPKVAQNLLIYLQNFDYHKILNLL
ncbi:MAG: ATP-binding protein [Spirulinaceae cyanobacterium]